MDLIYRAPDPEVPLKTPRERTERDPLSNTGWRWSHLIVAVLLFYTVMFTAAFGEWTAQKTELPQEVANLSQED
jgi:hypothetical protein